MEIDVPDLRMPNVRVSVKAVIIDSRTKLLLTIESVDDQGPWFHLPGGGQHHGETLLDALQRECIEEIGTRVEVGPLMFVRDYIEGHHEFAATSGDFHQVELMFSCRVPEGYAPGAGHLPDSTQKGVRWTELSSLPSVRFYPKALIRHLLEIRPVSTSPVYLGDVN